MPLRTPRSLGTLAACTAVLLAACQDTAPTAPTAGGPVAAKAAPAPAPTPPPFRYRSSMTVMDRLSKPPAPRGAIDGSTYVCYGTALNWWFGDRFWDALMTHWDQVVVLQQNYADLVPMFEATEFQTTATPQTFGYAGQHTQVLLKTERDVKRFWNIPAAAGIQLVGGHGTVLLDTQRTARAYQVGLPTTADSARKVATLVRDTLVATPPLARGNHPWFTFNAFAVWTSDGSVPDKIVMGDGILDGYAALGYGDVAPQAIYAHEFGHHVQHLRGYFNDPLAVARTAEDQPAATRYIELMADAYSAYFLTHARGAAMNRKRVAQFLQTFYEIGDCGFDYPGHHGTPNQRMAAARLGFTIADEFQKQGHILTPDQFHARFVAAYPQLVAPDAVPGEWIEF